jgi:broad specificity phosphatase PhoE
MPAGAESHEDVLRRMRAAIGRLVDGSSDDRSTLAVSHGGAIRIWLSALTGQAAPPVGNGEVLRFALADGQVRFLDSVELQIA